MRLVAHVLGDVAHDRPTVFAVFDPGDLVQHLFDVFPVMLVRHAVGGVVQPVGLRGDRLAARPRGGGGHVQLEVGDDEQVVPELVLQVVRIAEVVVDVAHHVDHDPGLLVAQVAVLDRFEELHHLVDVASVFRQVEFLPFEVVILVHSGQR